MRKALLPTYRNPTFANNSITGAVRSQEGKIFSLLKGFGKGNYFSRDFYLLPHKKATDFVFTAVISIPIAVALSFKV